MLKQVSFSSIDKLMFEATRLISTISHEQIKPFHVICTGGSTAKILYSKLALNYDTPATNWHVYLTDERCLPKDHPDRNDYLLREHLVRPLGINDSNFHCVKAELGPDQGAVEYSRLLSEVPRFDLALLTLGDDGHIASIFPDNPESKNLAYGVHISPKWPKQRVTLSAGCLKKAKTIILIACGESKRTALQKINQRASVVRNSLQGHENIILLTDLDERVSWVD
jgi:6-phosphogluconolactonase